jgi:hypothetical protein
VQLIYCLTTPTLGYRLVRGDLTTIPLITPDERSILLGAARSLNRYAPTIIGHTLAGQRSPFAGARPGDAFNAHADPLPYLERAGWRVVRQCGDVRYLCRPGKPRGVSATLGYIAPNVLFVFTTNAEPFDAGRAYTPFGVYAILEHGGDFAAAAKALAHRGYVGYCYPNGGLP